LPNWKGKPTRTGSGNWGQQAAHDSNSEEEKTVTITKDMPIGQIGQKHPETIAVFMQHGLACVGCAAAHFENLEQGAIAHGVDIDTLTKALNEAVSQPAEA